MIAKEEALQIIEEYKRHCDRPMNYKAKQCALFHVEGLIKELSRYAWVSMLSVEKRIKYFEKVKKYIEAYETKK